MNFEEALCAELQSISGLEGKVFPQSAPENTETPFAVYTSSEGEKIQTLEGFTNITELGFDVTVVASTYEQLKSFSKAISDKLRSFYGRPIGANGVEIKSISFLEPTEDFQAEQNYHTSTIDGRVRF